LTVFVDPTGSEQVVEIAPGRGNLAHTSGSFQNFLINQTSLSMIGGRTVSYAKLFATQPWVAAAVMRMLTWAVRVPLKVYKRTGDDSRERLRPGDHPLATAVDHPYDNASMADLIQWLLGPLLVHGNGVCDVEEGARGKIQFNAKDWRYTIPIMPWRGSLEGFRFDIDLSNMAYDRSIDQVLYVKWWSPTGPVGISPLQQLGTTLRIEDAAQRYQQSIFNNAGKPPSAVQMDKEFLGVDKLIRQEITKQVREDISNIYTTPENAGRPALLPPGLTWEMIGHSAVEAELIKQRMVAREECCAVYQLPPPMLGILDHATFSNIEVQREMAYTDSLGPPLVVIEQSINAQVVRDLMGEKDIYVEFDFGGVLRGDRLKEINALRLAIGSALMKPNEGRTILNLPRSQQPEMEEFYLPFNNLAPIGTPPVKYQKTPTPAPGDEPAQTSGGDPQQRQSRVLLVKSREGSYAKEVQ
jgi:HK97 family phage portal protein